MTKKRKERTFRMKKKNRSKKELRNDDKKRQIGTKTKTLRK